MAVQDLFQEIYGRSGSPEEVAALSGMSEDQIKGVLTNSINAWRAANAPAPAPVEAPAPFVPLFGAAPTPSPAPAPAMSLDDEAKNFIDYQLAQAPGFLDTRTGYGTIGEWYKAKGIDPYNAEEMKFAQQQVAGAKDRAAAWAAGDPGVVSAGPRPTYENLAPWANPNWQTETALRRAAEDAMREQAYYDDLRMGVSVGPGPAPGSTAAPTRDPVLAGILGNLDPVTALRAANIMRNGVSYYGQEPGDPQALAVARQLQGTALPETTLEKLFPSYGLPASGGALSTVAPSEATIAPTPGGALTTTTTGAPAGTTGALTQTTSKTGAPTDISSAIKGIELTPTYQELESGSRLTGYSSKPIDYNGSQITAIGDINGNLTGYEGSRQVRIGNNDGIAIDTYDANGKLISSRVDLDVGNKDTHVVTTYDASGNVTDKTSYRDTFNQELISNILTAATFSPMLSPFAKAAQAAVAASRGNALGAFTAGLGAAGGFGVQLPAGAGEIAKYAGAANALSKGDIVGAASMLVNSPDLKAASTGLNVIKAIQSGNPAALANAVVSMGNMIKSGPTTTSMNQSQEQIAMGVYNQAIRAGASPDEAAAAANAAISTSTRFSGAAGPADESVSKPFDSSGITKTSFGDITGGGEGVFPDEGGAGEGRRVETPMGQVPIYAESKEAADVEVPEGFRLMSTAEADDRPFGSYFDPEKSAWFVPTEPKAAIEVETSAEGNGVSSGNFVRSDRQAMAAAATNLAEGYAGAGASANDVADLALFANQFIGAGGIPSDVEGFARFMAGSTTSESVEEGEDLGRVNITERRPTEEAPDTAIAPIEATLPPVNISAPRETEPIEAELPPVTVRAPREPEPIEAELPPVTVRAPREPEPIEATLPPVAVRAPREPAPIETTLPPVTVTAPREPATPPPPAPRPPPPAPRPPSPAPSAPAPAPKVTSQMASAVISGAAGPELARLAAQYLKAQVMNQKQINPIAAVQQAIQDMEQQQVIDPRLLAAQRMQAEETPHYTYGSERSIDDILGGERTYAQGGYVQPLMAQGGMALPLLAKSGGPLSQYGGREDFKHGKHVAGKGDGQSDDIPAWLADGEYVLDAETVSALGNGSTKAGVQVLDEFRKQIREHKRGGSLHNIPPKSKGALGYLAMAHKAMKKK